MNYFKASPQYWCREQRLRDLEHMAQIKDSPWAGWMGWPVLASLTDILKLEKCSPLQVILKLR